MTLHFPAWLSLALLLGLLMEASFTPTRRSGAVSRWVHAVADRWAFVARQTWPQDPERAGLAWVASLVIAPSAIAWAVGAAGIVLGARWGPFGAAFGHLLADALVFFLLFDLRHRASQALDVAAWLQRERPDKARRALAAFGPDVGDEDPDRIAGATVFRLGELYLQLAASLVFWGLLLGPGGGAAAFLLHIAAERARFGGVDTAFGAWALKLDRAVILAPAYVAAAAMRFGATAVGARGSAAFDGTMLHANRPPEWRMGRAFAEALGLGPSAQGPEGGARTTAADIERAVLVFWSSTAALAIGGTALVYMARAAIG